MAHGVRNDPYRIYIRYALDTFENSFAAVNGGTAIHRPCRHQVIKHPPEPCLIGWGAGDQYQSAFAPLFSAIAASTTRLTIAVASAAFGTDGKAADPSGIGVRPSCCP